MKIPEPLEVLEALERLRNFYSEALPPEIICRNLVLSGEDGVNLRLWVLREKLGLSEEEFARIMGVPLAIYKEYERRGANVPLGFLESVSKKFSVSLRWLTFKEISRVL